MQGLQSRHGYCQVAQHPGAEAFPEIERAAIERLSLRILPPVEIMRRQVVQALRQPPVGGSELLRFIESSHVRGPGFAVTALAFEKICLLHASLPGRLTGKTGAAQKQN